MTRPPFRIGTLRLHGAAGPADPRRFADRLADALAKTLAETLARRLGPAATSVQLDRIRVTCPADARLSPERVADRIAEVINAKVRT
jgi:hypothetical protein